MSGFGLTLRETPSGFGQGGTSAAISAPKKAKNWLMTRAQSIATRNPQLLMVKQRHREERRKQ